MPAQPAFQVDFDATAPPPTDKPKDSGVLGQIPAGFHSEVASAIHATRNITGLIDKAAGKLAQTTGWDITKATKHVQDFLTENEEAETRKAGKYGAPSGVVGSAVRAASAAPVQMAEYGAAYAITRYKLAAYALVDAAKELDKGLGKAAWAGAVGAATGYGMERASRLPLKARIPAGAAMGAASTAITGGSGTDIATGGIVGGAFAALPPEGKSKKTTLKEKVDAITKGPVEHLDEFKKAFAPHLRGPQAKEGSLIIREQAAKADLNYRIAKQRAQAAWEFFQTKDPTYSLNFMKQMDVGGDIATLPAEAQPFAHTVRGMLDDLRDDLVKEGILKHYYDNYFPRSGMWEDPTKADRAVQTLSKRPLEGRKGYTKARVAPTIDEMINLGVKPKSVNPLDLVFDHVREANKAIAAKRILDEYQAKGLAQKVMFGKGKNRGLPPDKKDWRPLGRDPNDKTFVIYGPPSRKISVSYPDPSAPKGKGKITKDVRTGGITIMGQWYAPDQVAQVINNYLAPGMRGNKIYDSVQSAGNILNQYQLGLSGFHLGFTAIDSLVSNTATALHYLHAGRPLKAAATLAETPIAPFRYYSEGNKVLKAALAPGTQGGQLADTVDKIVSGGGRMQVDDRYRTQIAKQMREAFARGDIGRGLLRVPFIPAEYLSDFIMGRIVPRLKLGAISQLVNMKMDTIGPNATRDQWRSAMAEIVDSIDNRMGQVIYDNWFMNKFARDAAHIAMRSVGWNVGTFKEIAGGIADIRKLPKELTTRLAYTTALPVVIAATGALYQMMFTGKWPEEMRDYFFPKTGKKDEYGNDQRVSFPSYMKDLYNYKHDPVGTLSNKANPLFGSISEMLRNKDFYGEQIRNPGDSFLGQRLSDLEYMAKQFVPFSLRYAEQSKGEGLQEEVGPFIGVTPAPRYIGQSPAEQLASKFARLKEPVGGRSTQAVDRSQSVRDIEKQMRNHPEGAADMAASIQRGEIGKSDVKNIVKGVTETGLQRTVATLDLDQALDVWREASPAERKQLLPVITRKVRGIKNLPAKDAKRLLERLKTEVFTGQAKATTPPPGGPAFRVGF